MYRGNIYIAQMAGAVLVLFLLREKRNNGASLVRPKALNYAMLFSVTAIAATSQAVSNAEYLTISTVWIYYGLFLLMAFLLYHAAEFLAGYLISGDDIAVVVSIFMFALLNNPTAQSYFKMYGTTSLVFSVVFIPIIMSA